MGLKDRSLLGLGQTGGEPHRPRCKQPREGRAFGFKARQDGAFLFHSADNGHVGQCGPCLAEGPGRSLVDRVDN